MAISLTQDIVPVTEFKKNIKGTLAKLHRTGRPVALTVNGRVDVVMLDAAEYERQQALLEFDAFLAVGEADVLAGRTSPAKDVIARLRKRYAPKKKA